MRLSILVQCFVLILLLSCLQRPAYAVKKPYIVYLGSHTGSGRRLAADPETVTRSHHDLLSSLLQSVAKVGDSLLYSYNKIFDGFAAVLEEEEAKLLAEQPNVFSVFESRNRHPVTTRSWEFLGLEQNGVVSEESIWRKASFGEDVIIANLDSGVWPESSSFREEGFGPIPRKFKGRCENENDPKFRCNRKLIGARYFWKGQAQRRPFFMPFNNTKTPRDDDGHGTHTLSTAGGNFVPGANYMGFGSGTVKGGSPRARVAAYKVCWAGPFGMSDCDDADVLAGFEAAIEDDVDIISLSLGLGGLTEEYFQHSISIGSFYAVKNGITVVAAASNDGPKPETVDNVAPWILTVGASSIDREFTSHVILGNKKDITGSSRAEETMPAGKYFPLTSGAEAKLANADSNASLHCKNGTLDPLKLKGKIAVCLMGEVPPQEQIYEVVPGGAVGMIFVNDEKNGSYNKEPFGFNYPSTRISYTDGLAVLDYIKSTSSPVATLTQPKTDLGIKPAPVMADFSSRGPNKRTPEILKPDITGPGVSILAAYMPVEEAGNAPYQFLQGTSMSCPHVAGVAGLLKSVHPHLSPSAIKSAIMTTASTIDNTNQPIRDFDMTEATPFTYGAGHIRPSQAMDPGLVYDMDHHDYLNFLCALGYNKAMIKKFSKHTYHCPDSVSISDFNYPSITIPDFSGNAMVTRRLKNVGTPGTYSARIEAPAGITIVVEPKTLMFSKKKQELEYKLTFTAPSDRLPKDYSFGKIVWSDGKHIVTSPIVVKGKLP